MIKLSVVIITFNEEKKIERCLQSIVDIADEIVVVDSFSSDKTEEICLKYTKRFIKNKFIGHIEQKNFAIDQASFDHFLSLDADEVLSEKLKKSIQQVKENWNADGYIINRFTNVAGKWIRFGGWYPDKKLRLSVKQKVRWGGKNPHDILLPFQKMILKPLKGDLLHYSFITIDDQLTQIQKFSEIRAKDDYVNGLKSNILKRNLFPLFKFIKMYIFSLGFLDGYIGFVIAKNSAYSRYLRYKILQNLYKIK